MTSSSQESRDNSGIETLAAHAARLAGVRIADLFDGDGDRVRRFTARLGPLYLDTSKQLIDADAWQALLAFAADRQVAQARNAMFAGEVVNRSEGRAVLHVALRGSGSPSAAIRGEIDNTLARMARLTQSLRESPQDLGLPSITDVVSVGIGGSDFGPRLACQALADERSSGPRVHFLANVDGGRTARLCATLDPASTVVIIVSKSFGTQETLLNGRVLRDWLTAALGPDQAAARLFAVTANPEAAARFDIDAGRVLPMWDFVGGRYSLWSAVGFPVAIAIGMDGFRELLAGAQALDAHFGSAPLADNLPVRLALADFWNRDFLGYGSRCVVPYDDRLEALPGFLQQLEMESNGKRVGSDGEPVVLPTSPVIWGSVGSNAQHAYFQALHQGCDIVPVDFIGVIRPDHDLIDNHRALLANLFAQSAALMLGKDPQQAFAELAGIADDKAYRALAAQKTFPGNRPSTTILLDALTPHALGMLLALYEHKVFVQSVLWGINAFDQWGVELGKTLAARIEPTLADNCDDAAFDMSTRALLQCVRDLKR